MIEKGRRGKRRELGDDRGHTVAQWADQSLLFPPTPTRLPLHIQEQRAHVAEQTFVEFLRSANTTNVWLWSITAPPLTNYSTTPWQDIFVFSTKTGMVGFFKFPNPNHTGGALATLSAWSEAFFEKFSHTIMPRVMIAFTQSHSPRQEKQIMKY